MAEEQEDIIIIEEGNAANSDINDDKEEEVSEQNKKSKKNTPLAFVGITTTLIFFVFIISLLIFKSSKTTEIISTDFIEKKLTEIKKQPIEPSKLENMIVKADYLYSSGSKDKALALYERIALYSEAISQYNLGVAQLKNAQYKIALKTFQKAILNDEKRCVSAINAAVCSLHLKDKESFKYYIDLAYAYLPNEINSPLYSYYYALINYYNSNYLEALSALKNSTTDEYPNTQKHLSAKINALFGDNYNAIQNIEKNFDDFDAFSIGLLYARVGDLTLARKHLNDAIIRNIEPFKAQLALGFVNLKAGKIAKAAEQIKDLTDKFPEKVYEPYPIIVNLKKSIFDPKRIQIYYKKNINNRNRNYQKIFYFSPYKVFNANQTISYIRKGTANIYIDNISSAEAYLKKGASSSNVNKGITKAIKKALSFKTRAANKQLRELVKIQPKHSILHYNLALTYAQLGDMLNAHKHFLKSFHLDAKNYLSGIFAVMSSQLINKESKKLSSIVTDSIEDEKDDEKRQFYTTLLNITRNNFSAASDWLYKNYEQKPLYLALDIIISLKLNKKDIAKKSAQKLTILLPNEILPHLMYIDAHYNNLKSEDYASKVLNYLKIQKLHFNDLYFGSAITRTLYVQQNLIIGRLQFLIQQLENVLESTNENRDELTQTMAFATLYNQNFEKAYTLYNHIIDNLKIRDAKTLFLGAVVSTAAGHHENAIALLELSKMKDTNFLESRYALGLLYLQVKNNQGAVIQFAKIGNHKFSSEYFNFNVDLNKLLFEKGQKEK